MILGILQARISSSRLPGKVLKPLLGEPMLARQVERLRRVRGMDRLLIATSSDAEDGPIAELADRLGLPCHRGSLTDVLDRFVQAARPHAPKQVVRLTGDCPLADPGMIDRLIAFHLEGGYDYSSNCLTPTLPDGLDAEILTFATLEAAWRLARTPPEREHVTLHVNRRPQQYRIGALTDPRNLGHLRWTVDEPEDFTLVERIYAALYPQNPAFGMAEILDLLTRQPDLQRLNAMHIRNAGLDAGQAVEEESLV